MMKLASPLLLLALGSAVTACTDSADDTTDGDGHSDGDSDDASPSTGTFTMHFVDDNGAPGLAPDLVAFRDADGDWTAITPGADGAYTMDSASGRYGVVVGCTFDHRIGWTKSAFSTIAEHAELTWHDCGFPYPNHLTGEVTGVEDAAHVDIQAPWGGALIVGPGAFDIASAPRTTPVELFATAYDEAASGELSYVHVARKALGAVAGDMTTNLNFATEGAVAESHALVVTGVGADDTAFATNATVVTSANDYLLFPTNVGSSGVPPIFSLPATMQKAGDQFQGAVAVSHDAGTQYLTRVAYFTSPTALVTLPAAVAVTSPTQHVVNDAPSTTFTVPAIDALPGGTLLSLYLGSNLAMVSPGYAATAPTLTIDGALPVAGWNALWTTPVHGTWSVQLSSDHAAVAAGGHFGDPNSRVIGSDPRDLAAAHRFERERPRL